MELSNDLLSQFAKVTNDKKETKKETTVYGTVESIDGQKYVMIDGSELATPCDTTTAVEVGDRVAVQIKNHTATITGNMSSPAVKIGRVEDAEGQVSIYIHGIEAEEAVIVNLDATYANIRDLNAANAAIKNLTADKADIKDLNAANAEIDTLKAGYATITELEADFADINTLMFGSASGTSLHTSFANAVIAQLGDAQIKSAMIESVSADKITAGNIITNNVKVTSEDGKLLISDETIQISDSTRVRVQIGKDASGDYSINIWDADGKLMFSEGGITDNAIKNAIIRNDMVSDNANISASKLDIDSLFTEINGSEKTIKSTKIYLDDKNQTLDVAFTKMTSDLDDVNNTVSSQGTQISAIQGQITSKVWEQDIQDAIEGLEFDGDVQELATKYSELKQTVDGIEGTVETHTTTISGKADASVVDEINKNVVDLIVDANKFKTTVSDTYATKKDLSDNYYTIEQADSAIEQSASKINLKVSQTYATKQSLEDLEIGATNLILNSNFTNGIDKWVISGVSASVETDETHGSCLVITSSAVGSPSQRIYPSTTDNFTHTSGTYSLSFYAKTDTGSTATLQSNIAGGTAGAKNYNLTSSWTRYTHTYDASSGSITFWLNESGATAYITKVQVERGDKVTDWSPAPSELSTTKDIDDVKNSIDGVQTDIETATSEINILKNKLEFLATDGVNQSLLVQSGDSWVFNLGSITDSVNNVSKALDEVKKVNDQNSADVESLQSAVESMGELTERIKIGRYVYIDDEGETRDDSSIELYETDSEFKHVITNTQSLYLDGSNVVSTTNHWGQTVENIKVRNEFQQGKFVWKSRTSGNYGLMWKG